MKPQICHFGVAQAGRAGRVVYSAVESLKEMPLLGRAGRKAGTRELIIAGFAFIIIYRARTECVELLRILHAAQLLHAEQQGP